MKNVLQWTVVMILNMKAIFVQTEFTSKIVQNLLYSKLTSNSKDFVEKNKSVVSENRLSFCGGNFPKNKVQSLWRRRNGTRITYFCVFMCCYTQCTKFSDFPFSVLFFSLLCFFALYNVYLQCLNQSYGSCTN